MASWRKYTVHVGSKEVRLRLRKRGGGYDVGVETKGIGDSVIEVAGINEDGVSWIVREPNVLLTSAVRGLHRHFWPHAYRTPSYR